MKLHHAIATALATTQYRVVVSNPHLQNDRSGVFILVGGRDETMKLCFPARGFTTEGYILKAKVERSTTYHPTPNDLLRRDWDFYILQEDPE